MAHHANGKWCELCEEKVLTLDPRLQPIARHFKQTFEDGHISWGFRDEANQNQFFAEGKTRAKWPNSRHNTMKDGQPSAQAFDMFQIGSDGVPRWKADYCEDVWHVLDAAFPGLIEWGGNWKQMRGDLDHYQLKSPSNEGRLS